MQKKITIAIPTFERVEWTLRAFEQVLYDERVGEVVIVDDCSNIDDYARLLDCVEGMDKVRLERNEDNYGCYLNKCKAIYESKGPWCILLDSDNIITPDYLGKLYEHAWNEKTILAPMKGLPSLDYTHLSGQTLTKENISHFLGIGNTAMFLNTCNFFVNRDEYLRVFDKDVEPWTSDSIYFCYCWLAAGNWIRCVPDMNYTHTIHAQSHYATHNQKAPGFYESVIEKLKSLR